MIIKCDNCSSPHFIKDELNPIKTNDPIKKMVIKNLMVKPINWFVCDTCGAWNSFLNLKIGNKRI